VTTTTELLRTPPAGRAQHDEFVAYADSLDVNWSDELEALHEESSRDHFLDVWTRQAVLEPVLDVVGPEGVVVDAGCSTGYLLEDLRRVRPRANLIGVDLVAAGLRKAHAAVPDAQLALADVCALPIDDATVDAVVSANLLEHVPDDRGALREFHRVLVPGGRAAIVVPAGPSTYDYYDRFLGHERRYARHELAQKAEAAGFRVLADHHLAALLYPAFWLVKQRNRRRHPNPSADEMQRLVERDIARTTDSRVGAGATALERALLRRGIALPFGIRSLVVLERGAS
jgi:ubiquinone/menaquinone biosynthesis C-methylase UbiE